MKQKLVLLVVASTVGLVPGDVDAGTEVATEAVLRVYCSDRNGSSHPKVARIDHFITTDTFDGPGPKVFLLSYESTQCCQGVAGVIRGSLRSEEPDGTRTDLGNLTIRTDPRVVAGEGLTPITGSVPRGSAFGIDLRFSKFKTLAKDSCFNVTTALSR